MNGVRNLWCLVWSKSNLFTKDLYSFPFSSFQTNEACFAPRIIKLFRRSKRTAINENVKKSIIEAFCNASRRGLIIWGSRSMYRYPSQQWMESAHKCTFLSAVRVYRIVIHLEGRKFFFKQVILWRFNFSQSLSSLRNNWIPIFILDGPDRNAGQKAPLRVLPSTLIFFCPVSGAILAELKWKNEALIS